MLQVLSRNRHIAVVTGMKVLAGDHMDRH